MTILENTLAAKWEPVWREAGGHEVSTGQETITEVTGIVVFLLAPGDHLTRAAIEDVIRGTDELFQNETTEPRTGLPCAPIVAHVLHNRDLLNHIKWSLAVIPGGVVLTVDEIDPEFAPTREIEHDEEEV